MRRSLIVAFAIVAGLLVATATPVQAAGTNTAVGSTHTNASDFNAATELTNVTVSGSGAATSVVLDSEPVVVDDFEDADLSEYGGDTGSYGFETTTVKHGSASLDVPTNLDGIASTSGLAPYPEAGDTFSYYLYHSEGDTNTRLFFAAQSAVDYPDGYYIQVRGEDNKLGLRKVVGGSESDLASTSAAVSSNTGEWLEVEVQWGAGGTITVTLYDGAGNSLGSVSPSDSTYTSGGIGFEAFDSDGANTYVDYIINGAESLPSGTYVSPTHDVTDPGTGYANLSLSNATATVTWLADTNGDGGFETTIAQDTRSSTGNYSTSLSGTSADAWRVKVEFAKTGSSPTAELHDDLVTFTNHAPLAKNATASPNGSSTNAEDVQLSINVSDTEFDTAQGDTVDVQFYVDSSLVDTQQITSNGTVSTTASGLANGSHTWHVEISDDYGGTGVSDTFNFDVRHYAPALDNGSASPSGNAKLTSRDVTLRIPLNDTDFAESSGDTVGVEFFVDGSSIGTVQTTANGTVQKSAAVGLGGQHEWYVTATDEYGLSTTSQTFTMQVPSNITVREESEPHDIIKSATVVVLVSGSNETVDRQETTTGNISLEGLPTGERYVVVVNSDGYHQRAIYVPDIFDQSSVFLLNESNTSVGNTFVVQDNTGQYESPILEIEKPVNRSIYDSGAAEKYQWTTIGGDRLGASGSLTIDLKKHSRYRIVIQNPGGSTRVLGEYTAVVNGTVTLTVGDITWQNPEAEGYRIEAYQTNASGVEGGIQDRIVVQYGDSNNGTSEFCFAVHELGNASHELYPETCQTDLGESKTTIPVTGADLNTSWAVNWTATVNGTDHAATIPVTGVRELPIPIDSKWLGAGVYVMLIAVLAATPKASARTGALLVVAIAFGLTWWGWVDIPLAMLGLAGAIALLGKAADFGRGY